MQLNGLDADEDSVLVAPDAMPGFWKFMYYLSPFTYLINAVLSNGLARTEVRCSEIELLSLLPRAGETCAEFMAAYIQRSGGYVVESGGDECLYCPIDRTDTFLETLGIRYEERWRNFGILWGYTIFNAVVAMLIYWLARVPKRAQGGR